MVGRYVAAPSDLELSAASRQRSEKAAYRPIEWAAELYHRANDAADAHGRPRWSFPPALVGRGARLRVPAGEDPPSKHAAPRPWNGAAEPHGAPPARVVRRRCYRLRYYLKRIQQARVAACGHAVISEGGRVGVCLRDDGRAVYRGLARCGSVWECPVCALQIKASRAREIGTLVTERHGIERCAMLTLTLRHGAGDDLRALRRGLADAWRGFARGEPWRRFRAALGVVGTVRALELTHGEHGWHPHLHVLLLLDAPPRELFEIDGRERWIPHRWHGWAVERWREMAARYVGAAHVPDQTHGVDLVPCRRDDYLAKLGLELSDPGHKQGRRAGRTPLQIASDYADGEQAVRAGRNELRARKDRDAALWRGYCEAMRGARQLTWSRGLKDRYRIAERSDLDCAFDEEPRQDEAVTVGTIEPDAWREIRARHVRGVPLAYRVLVAVEHEGGPGLRRALDLVARGMAYAV